MNEDDETLNSTNHNYSLILRNVQIYRGFFSRQSTLIYLGDFYTSNNFVVTLDGFNFTELRFSSRFINYIIKAESNMRSPLIVSNSNFSNINMTSFLFKAAKSNSTAVPLRVIFRNITMLNLNFISNFTSIVTVRSKTTFTLIDSDIRNAFNQKRGGFVLADS